MLIDPPRSLPDDSAVSVLSLGELEVGVLRAADAERRARRLIRLRRIRDGMDVVPVDEPVVQVYALLVAASRELGRSAHVVDTLIAATAEAYGLTLVTRDVVQSRLPGIDVVLLPPS